MLDARAVDLLAHAVPAATFAPLYVNGGGGLAVRAAAAGLRAQLAKKPAHRPTRPGRLGLPDDVGPGPFRPAVHDPVLADAISGLINGQPARTDAVVDLFGADPTPALAEFQATALSAGFLAATVMAAAGYLDREGDGDRRDPFGDLVRVSASATAAGLLMRDLLTHPIPVADPPLGGGIDGPEIPGLSGIPADLLRTAEALRKRGCAGRAASALRQWAFAVGSSMGQYLRDVITALDPDDCCPGERMAIHGHDFGDGTSRAVVFTEGRRRARGRRHLRRAVVDRHRDRGHRARRSGEGTGRHRRVPGQCDAARRGGQHRDRRAGRLLRTDGHGPSRGDARPDDGSAARRSDGPGRRRQHLRRRRADDPVVHVSAVRCAVPG